MTKYQFTVMQFLDGEPFGLHELNHMGSLGWNMTGTIKYPSGVIEFYFSRPVQENTIDS